MSVGTRDLIQGRLTAFSHFFNTGKGFYLASVHLNVVSILSFNETLFVIIPLLTVLKDYCQIFSMVSDSLEITGWEERHTNTIVPFPLDSPLEFKVKFSIYLQTKAKDL